MRLIDSKQSDIFQYSLNVLIHFSDHRESINKDRSIYLEFHISFYWNIDENRIEEIEKMSLF